MNFECMINFQIIFFLKANLDLSKSKKFSPLSAVASSHMVFKRAAGDDMLPKLPDMPKMMPKMPDLPKIEIPQIKMRRKRQDFDPMSLMNGFKQMANATQTQFSKIMPQSFPNIPGIGSLFSTS